VFRGPVVGSSIPHGQMAQGGTVVTGAAVGGRVVNGAGAIVGRDEGVGVLVHTLHVGQ
jgi:hypothetical protein